MAKILCITDKKGRIQYNRLRLLKKYAKDFNMDIKCLDDNPNTKKYDAVYYSHFSLYDKIPCNQKCLASVTSHKCLNDIKKTRKKLKRFDYISVNNNILYNVFSKELGEKVAYTPNGVDTNFFIPTEKTLRPKLVLGWVGNRDRDTKNYKTVYRRIRNNKNVIAEFAEVASSKSDSDKKLRSPEEMRDFYNSIDFLLVTSTTEGTPNPALEAMSCGKPVISTRVGNIIDIISDDTIGLISDSLTVSERHLIKLINKARKMDENKYIEMSKKVRSVIVNEWSWDVRQKAWIDFLSRAI